MTLENIVGPETQKRIDFIEKTTSKKVLLILPVEAELTPKAIDAAVLAAMVVYLNGGSGNHVSAPKETVEKLLEILGLEARHMFKPDPCPLGAEGLEQALVYLRRAFESEPGIKVPSASGALTDRDQATTLVEWCKEVAQLS